MQKPTTSKECIECNFVTDEECLLCGDAVCDDCLDMHYAYDHPEES